MSIDTTVATLASVQSVTVRFAGLVALNDVSFEVKPGITGLAQVAGRNAVDWPERLVLDVQYVRERSLLGDLRVLMQTVPMVLGRRGVDNGEGVTMHELPVP